MRTKQLSFTRIGKRQISFGGAGLSGKRKAARPISTKNPMHIIIKSNELVFLRKMNVHSTNLKRVAKKWNVKLYEFQFNGNHLHAIARFVSRESYRGFIRELTAAFALIVGRAGIFPHRPFTRIVSWGKDLKSLLDYLILNEFEANGVKKRAGRIVLCKLRDTLW